jgi:E3 ubiquitin-protein ligase DOA10
MNSITINESIQGLMLPMSSPQDKCRICFNNMEVDEIEPYCACKGSIGVVHEECLIKWIIMQDLLKCEICHGEFNIKKKYNINPRLKNILIVSLLWVGLLLLNILGTFTQIGLLILVFIMLMIIANVLNMYMLKTIYIINSIQLMPFYNEHTTLLINED